MYELYKSICKCVNNVAKKKIKQTELIRITHAVLVYSLEFDIIKLSKYLVCS
jgi:hypothetical protein